MHRIARERLAALALLSAIAALAPSAAGEAARPRDPGDQDRCPVCGMFVAPYEAWIAQVVFEDASAVFFDGAKDLFKYLLARDRFLPERRDLEIAATFVTDYYELRPIAAGEAFFVVGSDVYGPMGPELVPHRSRAEAEEFLRDHGGERIVRFDEVTADLLHTLRPAVRRTDNGGR